MEFGEKRETFGFGCQKMVYIRREFDKQVQERVLNQNFGAIPNNSDSKGFSIPETVKKGFYMLAPVRNLVR